jgi:hypothetical protein
VPDLEVHIGGPHLAGQGGFQVGLDLGLVTRSAQNNPNAGKCFGGFGVVLRC